MHPGWPSSEPLNTLDTRNISPDSFAHGTPTSGTRSSEPALSYKPLQAPPGFAGGIGSLLLVGRYDSREHHSSHVCFSRSATMCKQSLWRGLAAALPPSAYPRPFYTSREQMGPLLSTERAHGREHLPSGGRGAQLPSRIMLVTAIPASPGSPRGTTHHHPMGIPRVSPPRDADVDEEGGGELPRPGNASLFSPSSSIRRPFPSFLAK